MTKLNFATIVICMLILQGCIPSLHGIFREDSRTIEDRILGEWALKDNDIEVETSVTVTADDSTDQLTVEEEILKLEDQLTSLERNSHWYFERAAFITFSNADGSFTMTVDPGSKSMKPQFMDIKHFKEYPYYVLTHKEMVLDDTMTTKVAVNLTTIGAYTYMDFQPNPILDEDFNGRFSWNRISGHTFARFYFDDNVLILQAFNSERLEKLIEKKRIRLKHENLGEDSIVLTASTDELRAFILKYENDEELFEEEEKLQFIDH